MKSFWGLYDNGRYKVGCSGATLYVYDGQGTELAKFSDVKYAYSGAFKPESDIFVAKSTEGKLAVYDLEKRELIKLISRKRPKAQNEGFAFSDDGRCFYNIEQSGTSSGTQLVVYDAVTFEAEKTLFSEEKNLCLGFLEFDSGHCYIAGFVRGSNGVLDHGFASELIDDEIRNTVSLSQEQYLYLTAYKAWELSGFTEKAHDQGLIKFYNDKPKVSIKGFLSDDGKFESPSILNFLNI